MKYYRIIFSPTGGTEKVANAITKNLEINRNNRSDSSGY